MKGVLKKPTVGTCIYRFIRISRICNISFDQLICKRKNYILETIALEFLFSV